MFELPKIREGASHIWHQYVLRSEKRDELIAYLDKKEIGTIIHYPIPPHLSEAYQYLGYKEGAFPITEQLCKIGGVHSDVQRHDRRGTEHCY